MPGHTRRSPSTQPTLEPTNHAGGPRVSVAWPRNTAPPTRLGVHTGTTYTAYDNNCTFTHTTRWLRTRPPPAWHPLPTRRPPCQYSCARGGAGGRGEISCQVAVVIIVSRAEPSRPLALEPCAGFARFSTCASLLIYFRKYKREWQALGTPDEHCTGAILRPTAREQIQVVSTRTQS